jgi:hypothetical protein
MIELSDSLEKKHSIDATGTIPIMLLVITLIIIMDSNNYCLYDYYKLLHHLKISAFFLVIGINMFPSGYSERFVV